MSHTPKHLHSYLCLRRQQQFVATPLWIIVTRAQNGKNLKLLYTLWYPATMQLTGLRLLYFYVAATWLHRVGGIFSPRPLRGDSRSDCSCNVTRFHKQ